jgi:hypothetical protein
MPEKSVHVLSLVSEYNNRLTASIAALPHHEAVGWSDYPQIPANSRRANSLPVQNAGIIVFFVFILQNVGKKLHI